jgi:SCF-associated factor 1
VYSTHKLNNKLNTTMADSPPLLNLPVEILLSIFPYLDANSFLSLTSSCKSLHQPEFVHEASFWSTIVRSTFRVPNQPVVQNDGKRWQKLYKRLHTQSRVMTWGDNQKACLGHSYTSPAGVRMRGGPHRGLSRAIRQKHISWPQKMEGIEGLGVVSDLQCGGWSTSLLTSKGAIYTVGVLDGLQFNNHRAPGMQQAKMDPTPLRFPPGFVQPWERHDSATAVRQFSSGRAHVLALSDSGRIWSWQNVDHDALNVRFVHHETVEGERERGRGVVLKVVAGWNKSAALIEGSGIVLWDPLTRENDESAIEDTVTVDESAVVPRTSHRETKTGRFSTAEEETLAETFGEVLNFIVLEHVVLFNTSLGKVFVSEITWNDEEQSLGEPIELSLTTSTEPDEAFATDLQGSFRNFAIFTKSGSVLTSHQDRLMPLLQGVEDSNSNPPFTRIPALQHKNVISVAFGDYHFHALHSPGYITSYGNEPQACGALGLGGHGDPEGRLRGIRYAGMGGDGRLVPHAYTEGRRIWFEEEKRQWIKFLTSGGADAEEAAERIRMAIGSPDLNGQGEVSEWIEQQGRDWEEKYGLKDQDEDGLGAYFALSVTAAGWHSGALVLVNDDLAQKISQACEIPDPKAVSPKEAEAEAKGEESNANPSSEEASANSSDSNNVSTPLPSSLFSTALDYGRWFLGVAPYSAASSSSSSSSLSNNSRQQSNNNTQPSARRHFEPADYGASPREGRLYAWAGDHFPRLRLSDGREMPGTVEFDEWRYGRPEWDLEFSL